MFRTYVVHNIDDLEIVMMRAEAEDELPKMYYDMLLERGADASDMVLEGVVEQFKTGEIMIECITYYEQKNRRIVKLF